MQLRCLMHTGHPPSHQEPEPRDDAANTRPPEPAPLRFGVEYDVGDPYVPPGFTPPTEATPAVSATPIPGEIVRAERPPTWWGACDDQVACPLPHAHERDPDGVLRHELPPEHFTNRTLRG